MPSVLVPCKLHISQALQGVIRSASKMDGYISNSLEDMLAVYDFLCDFECKCLVVVCETEVSWFQLG